jgi:hypothetical protein
LVSIEQDIAFGVHTRGDQAVDCHKLCQLMLKQADVDVMYGAQLSRFSIKGNRIESIMTSQGLQSILYQNVG